MAVARAVELLQGGQLQQRGGEGGQQVVVDIEGAEVPQAAQALGQPAQAVEAEVELLEAAQLGEAGRQARRAFGINLPV